MQGGHDHRRGRRGGSRGPAGRPSSGSVALTPTCLSSAGDRPPGKDEPLTADASASRIRPIVPQRPQRGQLCSAGRSPKSSARGRRPAPQARQERCYPCDADLMPVPSTCSSAGREADRASTKRHPAYARTGRAAAMQRRRDSGYGAGEGRPAAATTTVHRRWCLRTFRVADEANPCGSLSRRGRALMVQPLSTRPLASGPPARRAPTALRLRAERRGGPGRTGAITARTGARHDRPDTFASASKRRLVPPSLAASRSAVRLRVKSFVRRIRVVQFSL